MDKLARFMKYIVKKSPDCLDTFSGFIEAINPGADASYKSLYEGLCADTTRGWGWGPKTAALFSKVIYHLHMKGNPYGVVKIWNDAPDCIEADDRLWLPVDRVINEIFNRIRNEDMKYVKDVSEARFNKINNILQGIYNGDQIEVWDDLWFWGFITQRIREVKPNGEIMTEEEIRIRVENDEKKETIRNLEWNDNKYWSKRDTSKDADIIEKIKIEAKIFRDLLSP